MACYHPIKGYRASGGTIVFVASKALSNHSITVPCGQCIGCRLDRSRIWAIRCVHEASLHKDNCFLTLTLGPEHLPENLSLDVTQYQKFMKRLKSHIRRTEGYQAAKAVRFFHCGEYGETLGRPHYHACIFGYDFKDKILYKTNQNGDNLYLSPLLSKLWSLGHHLIGNVTFNSAAYVARYITKKINGSMASTHYQHINPTTGEITQRKPEYTTMSRRPGIGQAWLKKYQTDVYPSDFVIINNKKVKPPKYYDQQYALAQDGVFEEVKLARFFEQNDFEKHKKKRLRKAKKRAADNTPARLKVKERIQLSRLKQLKRSLDEEL